MNCVPFSSASPSFGPSSNGAQPNFFNASADGMRLPATTTSPSPISGRQRCASGARSPDAPSEPRSYTTGSTSALYMSMRRCTVAGATALCPKAMFCTFSTSMARTISAGTGSPLPQAWLITRFF